MVSSLSQMKYLHVKYIYTYSYIATWLLLHVHVYLTLPTSRYMLKCKRSSITYSAICTYMYVCVYIYIIYIIYIYVYIYIYVCTYIYVYIYICMYVYIYNICGYTIYDLCGKPNGSPLPSQLHELGQGVEGFGLGSRRPGSVVRKSWGKSSPLAFVSCI